MLLFLLPLLLNPFGLVVKWLPALYLAVWPIIIQTLGRDTLVAHALVLILFILTCDITRQIMLKLIGIDLISLPVGIALLAAFLTETGTTFLSVAIPIFGAILTAIEPIFLLIEVLLVMDMLGSFNKWLAAQANARDESSNDLSTWDPPLTRGAVFVRLVIILITISSYILTYVVLLESKGWHGQGEDVPLNFNQAIAALVTLQLIAFSTTIYKEEGVISESAMVALLASVPIFIASWSYHNLKETTDSSSSTWTSYLPFSIFASGGTKSGASSPLFGQQMFDQNGRLLADQEPNWQHQNQNEWAQIEQTLNQLTPFGLDGFSRQLLSGLLRRLIMIINSILGSSRTNLAQYYFGKDFWYTLLGRFICLAWWALVWSRRQASWSSDYCPHAATMNGVPIDTHQASSNATPMASRLSALANSLPFNKHTLVKVLLVLGYAQMLCQQIDNSNHLQANGLAYLGADSTQLDRAADSAACCTGASLEEHNQPDRRRAELGAWLECMWTSAKACSGGGREDEDKKVKSSNFVRFIRLLTNQATKVSEFILQMASLTYQRLFHFGSFLRTLNVVWLARWRSPIVQRLGQSILVQAYYIKTLLV